MNELSKHTPKERVDHGFVTKSLEQIAEVAKQINERQKMTQDVGVELEKVEDIDRVIEEAAGSRQDWKSQNGWLQHKGLFFSFFFEERNENSKNTKQELYYWIESKRLGS